MRERFEVRLCRRFVAGPVSLNDRATKNVLRARARLTNTTNVIIPFFAELLWRGPILNGKELFHM